jgi:N-acetylmuramoyl-L-alanine amidase
LAADIVPSPNHGERQGVTHPDMLILHYTGMADTAAALERLCSRDSGVSAHYLVREDGRITQCVAEERRAWHAGIAGWDRVTDVNSHSIGVEIANPGHEFGYVDFPAVQIDAVIALGRDILHRHGIGPARVLAHSDVAPARKQDPGEKFPWQTLWEAGVGLWVAPAPLGDRAGALAHGDDGPEVAVLQEHLRRYGYALDVTARYDHATEHVVAAFQRHFRQQRVDGRADPSTRDTLARLLGAQRG